MTEAQQSNGFSALQKYQYVNLVTFRKNGNPVVTPVWFALANGKAYVMTSMGAGKTKRIRNNPQVQIGPADSRGKALGPTVEGRARVLHADEVEKAKHALDDKYGLVKAVFDFFLTLRGTERAWIEIVPA